eukprot:COSAG06_NODE_3530_length_5224_cov_87.568865_2_plen_73_part_00
MAHLIGSDMWSPHLIGSDMWSPHLIGSDMWSPHLAACRYRKERKTVPEQLMKAWQPLDEYLLRGTLVYKPKD